MIINNDKTDTSISIDSKNGQVQNSNEHQKPHRPSKGNFRQAQRGTRHDVYHTPPLTADTNKEENKGGVR